LLDKRLDGFGELFRMLSYEQVGSAAMLSRATAGLAGETFVFALPGSTKALRLALDRLILPEIPHLLWQRGG
ncbi:MAG: molybdenum cofactor biosynthesis protein, partial [Acidobacteria bacterium]|nr:molybdenum cofactor biosynthesis protein [Acidobacteriota bacterium]